MVMNKNTIIILKESPESNIILMIDMMEVEEEEVLRRKDMEREIGEVSNRSIKRREKQQKM
jgi:hypothetical protein